MQDPGFLSVELLGIHLACQFGREVVQVLHEEAHSPSGCRRDLSHSAGVKEEVDVLGPGKARSPLLNPCQWSKSREMLIN